jgi:hypothetical protein
VIGRTGARRLAALLVIGDAVLGGALVGVLVRPATQAEQPSGAVVPTTDVSPATAPPPVFDADVAAVRPATPSSPPATVAASTTAPTTVAPATRPPATLPVAPTTAAQSEALPTTAPTTLPATTVPAPPPPPPPPPPSPEPDVTPADD